MAEMALVIIRITLKVDLDVKIVKFAGLLDRWSIEK